MEQWEHMLVTAIAGHNPQFIAFPASDAIASSGQPSAGQAIALLNELGDLGWQLVSANPADDFRSGTYWLKRRVPEPETGGGWATSV